MTNHRFAIKAHWILCKYSNIRLWLVCEMRTASFHKIQRLSVALFGPPRASWASGERRDGGNSNEREWVHCCKPVSTKRLQSISENCGLLPEGRSGGSKIYKISAQRARRYNRPRMNTETLNISAYQCNQWEYMSHGRARMDTETLNISEYQCNQWEYMSHGRHGWTRKRGMSEKTDIRLNNKKRKLWKQMNLLNHCSKRSNL